VRRAVVLALVSLAAMLFGCRQNDDPDGAKALFAKANEGAGFRSWRRAPDFPTRKASFTAHSREVEIFVNEPMAKALDDGAVTNGQWPVGSIIVKEGFSGDTRQLVAIMEKRQDGWHWTELDGDGEPIWSAANGKPDICVGCHDNREKYSDWVYSIELPR
jgi:hypothetical protein